MCSSRSTNTPPSNAPIPTTSLKPTHGELESLYKTLFEVGKPVVLSLVPGHAETYNPLQDRCVLPPPLISLYNKDYLQHSYPDLLSKYKEVYES